jgi:exodeoxyribonuclease-1
VNKNAVICIDLAQDIEPLLTLTSEEIKARLYTRYDDLAPDEKPIPVKLVHINKCPVIAPAKTLLPENAERLAIPRDYCLENLATLKKHAELRDKLSDVFATSDFDNTDVDAEQALYGGSFFSHSDKAQMDILRGLSPEQLASHPFNFQDDRLPVLLTRYRARNYPHTLTTEEQQHWQQYCQNKLQYGGKGILSLDEFMIKIENLVHEHEENKSKMTVLKALYEYVQGG